MTTIDPAAFGALCFVVIIDHHGGGWELAHPSYIEEKVAMIRMGYDAYAMLDRDNQERVLTYLKRWGYALPPELEKYEADLAQYRIYQDQD